MHIHDNNFICWYRWNCLNDNGEKGRKKNLATHMNSGIWFPIKLRFKKKIQSQAQFWRAGKLQTSSSITTSLCHSSKHVSLNLILHSNPPSLTPPPQTYGLSPQVASQRGHHVFENVLHHPDCGRVCCVRAPHVLGDVRDRVHQTLRQSQWRQMHHTLPGREPETTGQWSGRMVPGIDRLRFHFVVCLV